MIYVETIQSLAAIIAGKGLSQRSIAIQAGINPGHLCLYLQGKRDISGEKFFALLDCLDLKIVPKTAYQKAGIATIRIDKQHYRELFERFTAVNFDTIYNDGIVKAWDEILQLITEQGNETDKRELRKLLKSTSHIAHGKFTDILYLAFKSVIRAYNSSDALELRYIAQIPGFSFDLFPDEASKLDEERYLNSQEETLDKLIIDTVPF